MQYNRLGRCGLKVSQLSLGGGSWGSGAQDERFVRELLAAAMDHGIMYFDDAESYSDGRSEIVMGQALRSLGWSRLKYIVATKFFWGISKGPNEKNTLNRKYLLHAIDASLQRSQLEFVDIAYCHRPDPNTPIEETVWAFHDMIERGKALYWGTSEWSAQEIQAALDIAERHHLHKPIVEQPEYNLLHRRRVAGEYPRLCQDAGIGLAVWSPLAGGALTGKYMGGVPVNSRAAAMAGNAALGKSLVDRNRNAIVARLARIASDLSTSLTQLALAWCVSNPFVSTAIIGVSRPEQLIDNIKALALVPSITPEVRKAVEQAVGDYSESWVGSSPWHYEDRSHIRSIHV